MEHLRNPLHERRDKYRKIVEELRPAILENRNAELGTTIKCPLEEAARLYANDQIPTDYPEYFCRQDIKDAFKAGAKWQKKQMMQDAVDAIIYGYDDGSYELIASWLDLPKGIYKNGDKVRIIIVKEENK